jgi:hypothetical protein
MSKIQVDAIQSNNGSPVNVAFGCTIPSGQTLAASGDLSISGIITATSFTGSASGITGIPVILGSATFARMWTRI